VAHFFYGAFEPGGSVSVDKPPIDLWLQVASTKLLGFSSVSLRLPQAIVGALAVPLICGVVRRGFGRDAEERMRRALGAGIGAWLLSGYVLFSVQGRLRLRYLEAFTPAAALGIGLVLVVADFACRRGWAPQWTSRLVAVLAAARLIWPFTTSVRLIQAGTEDSQRLGAIPAAQVDLLSRYLSAHQSGVRYQLASSRTTIAAP